MKDETYNYFWERWQKEKEEWRKKGVNSFSGFVTKVLYEMIEREKTHTQ